MLWRHRGAVAGAQRDLVDRWPAPTAIGARGAPLRRSLLHACAAGSHGIEPLLGRQARSEMGNRLCSCPNEKAGTAGSKWGASKRNGATDSSRPIRAAAADSAAAMAGSKPGELTVRAPRVTASSETSRIGLGTHVPRGSCRPA